MILFCALYYITIYLFVYNEASDYQKIVIRGPNPHFASYVVHELEPLQVILENFSAVLRCSYQDYNQIYSSYYNNFKTGAFIIHISQVSISMSTTWQCEIVDLDNSHLNYTFDIRVKGAKGVKVKVNGVYEVYLNTNLTDLKCDGIVEHEYEEEDIVDLTCSNLYNSGQIRLQYYDVYGTIKLGVQDTGINYGLIFRMLIKDKSVNQSYIDCTYVAPITKQEFTYRTIFRVITNNNNRNSNNFIVTVNGMELTPLPQKIHGRDKYIYYYTDGAPIKLTCVKKSKLILGDIYGKIINNDRTNVVTKDVVNTSSIYSTLIETAHLDGVILQCYSVSEQSDMAVDILFLKDDGHDPVIRGLPSSNIVYQYSTGNKEVITHYQYTTKHVLNLTCLTAINRQPVWKYKENITSTIHEDKIYGTKYINYTFNFDIESNETIICESTNSGTGTHRTIIVLHYVSPRSEVSLTVPEGIGVIIGVLGAVITGVSMLYCWRLKINNIQ